MLNKIDRLNRKYEIKQPKPLFTKHMAKIVVKRLNEMRFAYKK